MSVSAFLRAREVAYREFAWPLLDAWFGFLRLRGETLGLDPEAADASVRQFVRATVHRDASA